MSHFCLLNMLIVVGQIHLAPAELVLFDPTVNRRGPNALAVCFDSMQHTVPEKTFLKYFPYNGKDSSLAELKAAAELMGVSTKAVRWNQGPPRFDFGSTPAVVPIRNSDATLHFVAMLACDGESITVLDAPLPPDRISIAEFRHQSGWDGTALHFATDQERLNRLWMAAPPWPHGVLWLAMLVSLAGCLFSLSGISPAHLRRVAKAFPTRSICGLKKGFTITELVVSLAVVGLLLSVIAPAIQSARETSRKLHCGHNLRQLSLAASAYETFYNVLPPSTVPYSTSHLRRDPVRALSAHARLLPYLDQKPLFDQINVSETGEGSIFEPISSRWNQALLSRSVRLFECPSDSVPPGSVNYRLCTGSAPGWPSRSMKGLFWGRRDQEYLDGRSQTVMFSERLTGDQNSAVYTPWRDTAFVRGMNITDPDDMSAICRRTVTVSNDHWSWGGGSWLFSGYGNTWYNHVNTPNSSSPDCVGNSQASHIFELGQNGAHTARSFHRGGVNVVFADGASRIMNDNIDLKIWRALGTVAGNEATGDF